MPEYPGGQVALMRYIAQNVKYPKSAQENGTQGKVVVQFVVDTDGSIINAYVLTSVDPDLVTETPSGLLSQCLDGHRESRRVKTSE